MTVKNKIKHPRKNNFHKAISKKNYKTSDRKRDESAFDKLREYADVYEYGTSDDSD